MVSNQWGHKTLPSTYQNVALVACNYHVEFPTWEMTMWEGTGPLPHSGCSNYEKGPCVRPDVVELDVFLTSSGECSPVACVHALKCRPSEPRLWSSLVGIGLAMDYLHGPQSYFNCLCYQKWPLQKLLYFERDLCSAWDMSMGNTMVKLDMLLSTKTYYTDNTITLSDLAPMSRTPNSFMVQLVKCYGALFVPFEKIRWIQQQMYALN